MIASLSRGRGFLAVGRVLVYDLEDAQRLFYSRTFTNGGRFNLPRGKWLIFGNVRGCKMHTFERPNLPRAERNMKMQCSRIVVTPNPNKASTNPRTGLIVIDPKISKSKRAELMFILCHEKGHTYYKTEWKCDCFSASKMLDMGFNPSQIAKAALSTLKIKNAERIIKVFNFGDQSRFKA